jgi:hypothetical protein
MGVFLAWSKNIYLAPLLGHMQPRSWLRMRWNSMGKMGTETRANLRNGSATLQLLEHIRASMNSNAALACYPILILLAPPYLLRFSGVYQVYSDYQDRLVLVGEQQ